MVRLTAVLISLCAIIPFAAAFAQNSGMSQAPPKSIDNGIVHAEIYLPDATNGFYRGTRFDWAGVISQLKYAGHNFYGPWFDRFDPSVHDYVVQGSDIVVGRESGSMGPTEEFDIPLGYDDAPAGGTFVKVGVGVLRKPDTARYDPYRSYDIVDGGERTIKSRPTSVTFEQRVFDKSSGYGYIYRKTIQLVAGRPQMLIEHSLKNIGTRTIETSVYDHNFLVLDDQPTGPDFTIRVPFTIKAEKPFNSEFGSIDGNTIKYKKVLTGKERFSVDIGGYSDTPADNDITIENAKEKASVRVTGDRPLASLALFSIRSTIAMEPFVRVSVAQGEEFTWRYSYTYNATQ
ncbi:MAG TPA: hypothetical protein VMB47_15280 [Candidatus Aquilonibacter sp.]|nr:hypothetical protein [Candidatus Aquilonibacter sp.]